ncbi:MAG: insulinase family protein, partial [Paramuribaculum sp.]|nr:insulinase family protein [Paramuribaculum sp.]
AGMAAEMRSYGSIKMSGEQIAVALVLKGAVLKSFSSAHHSSSTILTLSDKVRSVIPVAAEAILNSVFPQRETEIIAARKAEECEIAQTTEMFKVNARSKELLFGFDHPLARTPLAADFRSVGRDDIISFYEATQHPSNLTIHAYGRITLDIEEEINRTFGSVKDETDTLKLKIVPFSPAEADFHEHIKVENSVQTALDVSIPSISRSHPDYLALRLAVMALGGYFGSRLQQNIREDKGLTYGISAALLGRPEGSSISVRTSCNHDYLTQVREEIFKEMLKMSAEPMTREEIKRLKLAEIGSLMDVTDSPESIIGFHRTIYSENLPADYFAQRIEAVNRIDAEDIMRVAAAYFLPEKAISVSAGQ